MPRERKTVTPRTIVIKLGTSSIVHETTHQTLLSTLSALVETVVELKRHGHKVVLVSSGAIAVGLKRMDLLKRPESLSGKQALAAIGQGRLIALWDNLFGQLEQPIAQVLLTRGDISDRTRYLNAVNTLKELLNMGVVPIVNENDTISVSEIKFGDNDTLSAITSSMVHADYLFLLTDVDGLYTSNPRKDPTAKQIEVVTSIAAIRGQVSTTTLGSSLGTGGMETKLIAADISTAAGVTTIITSSKHPENIFDIIEYDIHTSPHKRPKSTDTAPLHPPTPAPPRPPHTLFTAAPEPMRDLKAWTSHTLNPSGSVVIDAGAYHVLSKRESGGRLLAAGVVGVAGPFAAGTAVRVVIRQRRIGAEQREEERRAYLRALETTRPSSPHAARAFEADDAVEVEDAREELYKVEDVGGVEVGVEAGEGEVIEVGRGLANYNSAQILAVKGLNSSLLPQVLGYADSEYVVENITIRVPFSPSSYV
ncbi:glutamate 5-kinase [Pholiota molesta]|nr:glutamate 5-kinase [Pholiota molesta]